MSDNDNHNTHSEKSASTTNRGRRLLLRAVRTLVMSYAAILIMLVVFETYFVFPGSYITDPVVETDSFYVDVSYQCDQISLHGYLHKHQAANDTILFFHGNGSRACDNQHRARQIAIALNANIMIVEYRGFAGDDNTPTESGMIADGLAAHDFLCQELGIQPDQMIIYGQSMGGGCAVAVAANRGAKLLILDRTFDSAANVGAGKYPIFPVQLLMRNQFDSVMRIQDFHGPLVQFHGDVDRVIPIERGKRLFDHAPSKNKKWIQVENLGHNDAVPDSLLNEVVANASLLMNSVK